MIARFMKFSAAGALGFLIQIAGIALLTTLGLHYLAATAIAVELAIVINFAWHRAITWADRPGSNALRQFVRFNALTAVTSLAASVALTGLLVETAGVSPVTANVISVAALGVVNFIGADTVVFRTVALLIALSITTTAHASPSDGEATLQAKTVRDFAKYSAAVEARAARGIADNEPFLEFERRPAAEQARILAMLQRGEVYVERAAPARDAQSKEVAIDGGLVNHWRGTVFVPKVSLDNLLKVLQEPQTDQHKQEDVLSSKVIARNGDQQKVYLRLRRTKFVTVVYDTEYDVEYRRLAPDRAASTSLSTRIVEIEGAGTPSERSLPEGDDHGYMWRLNTYWRYKQLNDGVLVEVESVTLSRDLPFIIGPLISPIVSSTARESMSRTLASVRARFAH